MKSFPLLPPSGDKARRLVYVLTFLVFLLTGFSHGLLFLLLFMLAHGTLRMPKPTQKVWVCFALASFGLWGQGGLLAQGTSPYPALACAGIFLSLLLLLRFWFTLFFQRPRKVLSLSLLCSIPGGFLVGFYPPFFLFIGAILLAFTSVTGPWKRRLLVLVGLMAGFWLGGTLSFALALAPEPVKETVGAFDWRLFFLYGLMPFSIALHMLFARNKRKEDRFADSIPVRLLLWFSVYAPLLWLAMETSGTLLPLEMLSPLLIVLLCGLLPLPATTRGLLAAFFLILNLMPGTYHPPVLEEVLPPHPAEIEKPLPLPAPVEPMEMPHE